ncbi:hypothetical protein AB5I41_03690 [Sphingomonas sp. MMS24-JH45]
MAEGEVGEIDEDVEQDADDVEEDELQEDFDDDAVAEDGVDDKTDSALRP